MNKILLALDETKGSLAVVEILNSLLGGCVGGGCVPKSIILLFVQKLEGRSVMDGLLLSASETETLKESLQGTEYQEATGKKAGIHLIDSRSKKEHDGEDIRALRGGHVPNTSINVSHKDTMIKELDKKTEKWKPPVLLTPMQSRKNSAHLTRASAPLATARPGPVPPLHIWN